MVFSKYNYYIEDLKNIWIYNSYTRRIIKTDLIMFEKIKKQIKVDVKLIDSNIIQWLLDAGIICEDGTMESEWLIKSYQNSKVQSSLEFIIMASTSCNFNCQYCYENLVPQIIDDNFSAVFLECLKKNISFFPGLFIEWFGGEPLLAGKKIIDLTKQIKEIAKKNHKPYLSSITTNGYLLDVDKFIQLVQGNVVFFQITIDGLKEWHDKYRPLKSGEGTYDVIIENLRQIKFTIPKYKYFRVVVRNNVSICNKDSCDAFKKFFLDEFSDDNRFQIFQYPIKDWGGSRINKIKADLINESTLDTRNDILESISSLGCIASKKNGYVVTPELKLYKCSHYLGDNSNIKYKNQVGYITNEGRIYVDPKVNNQWLCQDIHNICYECKHLPSCITICPLHKVQPTIGCQLKTEKDIVRKIQHFIEKTEGVTFERKIFYV